MTVAMFMKPSGRSSYAGLLPAGRKKVELLIISALLQPCHRSAHRGSTWFHLSRCKDRKIIRYFQIFWRKSIKIAYSIGLIIDSMKAISSSVRLYFL